MAEESAKRIFFYYPPSLVVGSLSEEVGVSRSDPPSVVSYPLSLVVDSLLQRGPLGEGGVSHPNYPSVFGHHSFVAVGNLVLRILLEEE